jgi:photosystem II stability/assembly factor-like uncharacterized protein
VDSAPTWIVIACRRYQCMSCGAIWIAGSSCTMARTRDGGASFAVSSPCPSPRGVDLDAIWVSGDEVYAAGSKNISGADPMRAIYHTSDGGKHWSTVEPQEPDDRWPSWSIWGTSPDDVYLGRLALWRSTDRGGTWRIVHGVPKAGASIGDRAFGVGSDVYLIVERTLLHSASHGDTWEQRRLPANVAPSFVGQPLGIWIDRSSGLWVALDGGGLSRSRDKGETWAEVHLPPATNASLVQAVVRRASGELVVWRGETLLGSSDDGATWVPRTVLPQLMRSIMDIDQRLVVVGEGGRILQLP